MTDQDLEIIKQTLRDLLERTGITAEIETRVADSEATTVFNLRTADSGILIGAHGQNLGALQYLVRILTYRKLSSPAHFIIDVEDYKKTREEFLRELARQAAARVRETKETLLLKPMPPYERRVIHDELSKLDGISSESQGEDPERQVLIKPRQGGQSEDEPKENT